MLRNISKRELFSVHDPGYFLFLVKRDSFFHRKGLSHQSLSGLFFMERIFFFSPYKGFSKRLNFFIENEMDLEMRKSRKWFELKRRVGKFKLRVGKEKELASSNKELEKKKVGKLKLRVGKESWKI